MLLLKYLLMITGWGLLIAAAANVAKNLYKVVQYHQRMRPIAPLSAPPPLPDGDVAGRPHLNWTTAK